MKHLFITLILLSATAELFAQIRATPADTSERRQAGNLRETFQKGHFHGGFRSYFMATDNARQLQDYYALAGGGSLHYQTAAFHGFRFGLGGVFHYNLASTDLGKRDPATNAANRYEIGLFDITDPSNRSDLDRMEDFWLRYEWKKAQVTLGQQAIQTPFINPQDGRMRPTLVTGLWGETNDLKHWKMEGGWIWRVSPRSTVKWYSVGHSIGIYPKGLNPDGTASGYPENLESKGAALLGITRRFGPRLQLQIWDQYVEHIFNTALAQVDYTHPLRNGHKALVGLQWTNQNALAAGGHEDQTRTYFPRGARSNVVSAQAGWQHNGWQALAAWTHTTGDGRFLNPREWGREPFYTFMPRERIEGSGDVQAVTGRISWQPADKKWRLEAAYGRFYLPDVKNVSLNKYGFPSYEQFNFDARYTFGGALKGLRAQLLVVWKGRLGETYGNDKFVINKVDMTLYNLVLNYTY